MTIGRILLDVPCKVCRDHSSGKHYGIYACDGCAGFFKRSIRRNRQYACKAKAEGGCMVDKTHRNQCRACRLNKCIQAGMNRDAVQHERGPRNSTLRRQMALYYAPKDHDLLTSVVSPPNGALDLVLPKPQSEPRSPVASPSSTTHSVHPHQIYHASVNVSKVSPAPPSEAVSPVPRYPSSIGDTICEQAARILFLNVTWARDLNINSGLCVEDQLTVLESSWRELFLISAAQYSPQLDPTPLLPAGPQAIGLAMEVNRFRETIVAFHALNLDLHEYTWVKAVVMYKAGLDYECAVPSSRSSNGSVSPGGSRLKDPAMVVRLREGAQTALGARMAATSSFGAVRFSKLILMLPMLRTVSPHAIEECFFRKTIGYYRPIEKIIADVYTKSLPGQRPEC